MVEEQAGDQFTWRAGAGWGIDTLFGSVPLNCGGRRDGPLSRDGFWYDRTGHDAGGHPIVVIRYGQVGRRMLHSSCDAVATFAHGGDHLVIDEMLLTPDLLPIWIDALAGLDIQLVCVTCPLSVAERPPASTARGCLSSPWNRVCGDTAPPLRHPMLQSKCG